LKTKSFKDLIVWQKAYRLVLEVYKIIENLIKEVGSMLYRILIRYAKRCTLYAILKKERLNIIDE